ncbi:MAG TPA: hypothetical protein PK047_04900 [Saprospiraceae bacterium]|nr:hypothetical protein [Saprospiraceae bacterium]HRO08183.1 hypothetical protein [Saprospiraceae bacterium]HRP41576.1 hypothetical protein [Saprospiraceae bacterium]
MQTIIKKNEYMNAFWVLLPFILIFGGTVFQNTQWSNITSITKMMSFGYMIVYVVFKQKTSANLVLFLMFFIPFWTYALFNNPYNQAAANADAIRYLFPIATLFYSFAIKEYLPLLLKFVIAFIVINMIIQLFNYAFWIAGAKDQWFYYTMPGGVRWANKTAGLIRATGTVVFFSLYGFINLIAFFLIHKYYHKKYKNILLALCVLGLFLSFSYKGIGAFAVVLAFYYYKHIYKVALYTLLGLLMIYIAMPSKINSFMYDISLRISLYITEGNSVRSESYRVMFREMGNNNWLGKGAGVFGGPASVEFNSPYYSEIKFNWYDTKWMGLTTTDTYPPHAFVELGTIGGILYFLLLLSPLFRTWIDSNYKMALVIFFCLMSDMLVSFSLNNLEYLFFSLVFVYPVLYYKPEGEVQS